MLEGCTPETRAVINRIMDAMAGADGGVAFVKLCRMVEDMDRKAQAGDTGAAQVVDVAVRFDRLIASASKFY